ncbi:MAG TPA: nucleotidyltransferase family protein [Nitrospiraceae bacterium]
MKLPDVHPFLWTLLRPESGDGHPSLEPDDSAWEAILRDTSEQSLITLLYRSDQESHRTHRLPPSMHNRLKTEMARLTAKNMLLTAELTAILTRCRNCGLACVPLRGLALAEQLHGPGAPRPTGDIDLLVRRADVPVIAGILAALGYAGMEHRPGFAGTFSYTLEFVKDRHGWIVVEPHWTLAYPPFTEALDMEQVWSRCRKGSVIGIDAWRLSDEDLLVHLCFHILHQGDKTPLLWWYELDLLIRQTQASLNWDTITTTAKRSGQSLLVSEVLEALRERFHSPIPQSTLTSLAAQSSRAPLATLLVHAPGLSGREEFAQFVSLPGFLAKLRYALGLLCPAPDYMIRRYGVRSHTQLGIAYATRLLHLFWEGLRWSGALLTAACSTKAPTIR